LWTFGDGATASGVTTVHAYAAAGSYAVQLTVTDNGGITNTASTTALITDGAGLQSPVARPAGPYQGTPSASVAFDGSASSDADGTIVSYDWRFGDGGIAAGAKPTHVYNAAGTYTVTLTVTDDSGRTGTASTTATIKAGNTGAELYSSNCADCHGDPWTGSAVDAALSGHKRVTGARSCTITGAVFGTSLFPAGVPDMVSSGNQLLTATQIEAIAGYLESSTVSGEQRYVATCAGCHGNDGRGGRAGGNVRGASTNDIAEAIREKQAMQFLSCVPTSDIQAMSSFLKAGSTSGSSDGGGGGGGTTDGALVLGLLVFGGLRALRSTLLRPQ
jgi:PKD repeat protein